MKELLSLLNSGLADNPLTAWRESWRGSATWRPNLARKLARFGDLATKFGRKLARFGDLATKFGEKVGAVRRLGDQIWRKNLYRIREVSSPYDA